MRIQIQIQITEVLMKSIKLMATAGLVLFGSHAQATYYWSSAINDYTISLDNGVVYINSSQFVAPCLYSRLEIRDNVPYSNDYAKRLTAAIYMAKASGKNVTFVWNDATAPTCVLSAITISN